MMKCELYKLQALPGSIEKQTIIIGSRETNGNNNNNLLRLLLFFQSVPLAFQWLLHKFVYKKYYPDEHLYYKLKYWLFLLDIFKYIFGFSFVL